MRKHIVFGLIFGILLAYGASKVHAQATTAATPYSIQVTGTLANCPVVTAGTTQYCFTTTGIYQSLSGATWALVGAAGAGVTSVEICTGLASSTCTSPKTGAAVFTLTPAAPSATTTVGVPPFTAQ